MWGSPARTPRGSEGPGTHIRDRRFQRPVVLTLEARAKNDLMFRGISRNEKQDGQVFARRIEGSVWVILL